MSASLNKVVLIGNLGRNVELRYTPSGAAVASLSIATSGRRKDKNTGQWSDETQWHRITVLGDQAQWAHEKLDKGRTVYIEGALRYGSYEKDGQRVYTTEIVATHIEPFGAKPKAKANGEEGQGGQGQGADEHDEANRKWVAEYDGADHA